MKNISEIIIISPISNNKLWQGRRYKTLLYTDWIKEGLFIMPKRNRIKGNVKIQLYFYIKHFNFNRCDLDNFLKPTIDLIVKKGWISNDKKIQRIICEKKKAENDKEKIEIIIEEEKKR